MRMLQLLSLAIVGYIVWKIVKLAKLMRDSRDHSEKQAVDFPQDHSYRNIEDADFEDITRDPDKSS
jgi:hypothetical protein